MTIASFDVDAQKGFTPLCPDELPVEGGDEIVDELNYLASKVDYRIGSKDAHPEFPVWLANEDRPMLTALDYPNADLAWNRHCVVGTKGFELLDGLPKPEEYDFFVWKGMEPDLHPYGACFHDIEEKLETGVFQYLKYKGVDTVVVAGLAYDYCVSTTALQLAKEGFKVYIYKPATRGISIDSCDSATKSMLDAGIIILDNREELSTIV